MKRSMDFNAREYDTSKMIVVYGASSYGEIAYYLLKENGLTPNYYCDRAYPGESYMGVPVVRPEWLCQHKDSAYVLIASADYYHEICDSLQSFGVQNICDMQWLVENTKIDEVSLSKRGHDIYKNVKNYMDVVNQNCDDVNFTRIQYVVSERCSLKCKDCTHLMQYYVKPENIDLEQYKPAFERLLSVTNSISELRILGGEPFMNPEMYRLIDWYHDNPKIKSIRIYTNGTIIPNENTLGQMTRNKVQVRISDYGFNKPTIDRFTKVLDERKIVYYVNPYSDWQDAGGLSARGYTAEKMKSIFSSCFERNCITFYRGQLHRCPRSAHAMRLGAMPNISSDYIDFVNYEGTNEALVAAIKTLLKRDYIQACNYCDGPNRNTQSIKAAIQVKEPLQFDRYTV